MTFCKRRVCRASAKDELQTIGRPASLEAPAGRPIVHNSTRFSSTPRVANIPRYALHVHNALRRNQALLDPHLCPKPPLFVPVRGGDRIRRIPVDVRTVLAMRCASAQASAVVSLRFAEVGFCIIDYIYNIQQKPS